MKIVFTPMAHQDLIDIHDYISDVLKNPKAAKSVTHKILMSCQRLGDFPNLGVSLKEKTGLDTDYRCLFCDHYIASTLLKIVSSLSAEYLMGEPNI